MGASIMASATPAASAPPRCTAAREARSMQALRRDAAGSPGAEMVSEAHDLSPWCWHGEGQGKDTCSRPPLHGRGRLFCLGAAA